MADTGTAAISITPVSGRVHIIFDDGEIASSLRALRLEKAGGESQIFVPFEDVHPGILEASETIREDQDAGAAHYYTIKTLTADGPDNAWYYPYAEGEFAPIRDLVTFVGENIEVRFSDV